MTLKNLNPQAGRAQIVNGYFCCPRIMVLLLSKQITPKLIGFFIIALCSADWDKSPHRLGYIRQSLRELEKIWKQKHSTIKRNFDQLVKKGLLSWDKVNKVYQINNYHSFTFAGSNSIARNIKNLAKNDKKMLITELIENQNTEKINLFCNSLQTNEDHSFNYLFKNSSNVCSNDCKLMLDDKEVDKITSKIPF